MRGRVPGKVMGDVPSDLVSNMIAAARAAAPALITGFRCHAALHVREKGPGDFVSDADLEAERAIFETLTRADARACFQSEETRAGEVTSGRRYIVDPLDGTTNFVRKIPHFCISIAYADELGVAAGVILDPLRDELFWGERERGAYLGDERLAVATGAPPAGGLVHTGIPPSRSPYYARYLAQLARLMGRTSSVRRLGSAALDLAYVAAGRGDAFFEPGLKPWDIAAGLVLVREAGGVVTDHAGGDTMLACGDVLAASPLLHPTLLGLLAER